MMWDRLRYFWQLEQEQWLSPAQLSELRRNRLQRLIAHAYERVPYYRRLFDEYRIHPRDIVNVEDLQKVPLLTKQTLQQDSLTDFLADGIDPKQCEIIKTSGSTGHPLTVLRMKHENMYSNLSYSSACFANGLRPWHKQAVIVSSPQIPSSKNLINRIRKHMKIYLWPGQNVQEQIEILRSYRPHVIRGYSQSLKLLAYAIKQSRIKDISPQLVFGVAELLDGQSRGLINEVFGVEMIDMYGSEEAGCIAWECPQHCGYHINTHTLIVEFIRDGRPAKAGELGHIVITPLYQYAMPLIRYDLGDIGIITDRHCPCGRALPLMEVIKGRADNFITLPSGLVVAPVGTFADVIENEPAIVEYLVVQEDYDLIVVKLIIRDKSDTKTIERVRCGIEDIIWHEALVKVEVVDRIERGPEEKISRIISKVPVNF